MKEIKTNVMRILDKEKVEYTHHEYPHGKDAVDGVTVATLMNQNPDYVVKIPKALTSCDNIKRFIRKIYILCCYSKIFYIHTF